MEAEVWMLLLWHLPGGERTRCGQSLAALDPPNYNKWANRLDFNPSYSFCHTCYADAEQLSVAAADLRVGDLVWHETDDDYFEWVPVKEPVEIRGDGLRVAAIVFGRGDTRDADYPRPEYVYRVLRPSDAQPSPLG